ncbi:hypothetical protein AK830_g7327 [Neonectria ditissima]|uniref:Uncharacterized protein n=1 Tax=Neonectria ditissima TaxID=78410 RepID=A0A0P7BAE4_9HYPO|nr:hypothetical protein AK830_g7327 [Neonectria ditissima]
MATTTVREDHTHWACGRPLRNDPSVACLGGNPMTINICQTCRYPRSVGSEALNEIGDQIGTLARVDKNRTEWWRYFA